MANNKQKEEELKKEIAYYKKQLDQLTGRAMRFDLSITAMRHSLKQKSNMFAVLTTLQKKYTVATSFDTLLSETIKAITTNLDMHRSVALVPAGDDGKYKISHHYGFPPDAPFISKPNFITIGKQYLNTDGFMLVSKKTEANDTIVQLQQDLSLNFFVGLPLVHDDAPVAFIITGRIVERPPFAPVLDKGDVDSLSAIVSLMNSVLQNKKLIAVELAKTAVESENEIITSQRNALEKTLHDLKTAQAQLIQSEKMASLGELTAGIAHEIQNPLNFVNNFSEINAELIDEADNEMNKGNISDAKMILNEIKENEQKIVHHGKRADAIVKGMLQHSRTSTGVKELTDINELTDEYLRLAYHGLKAKEKSFNATLKTDFDMNIQKINIIPQDIGRVILNLITNAFYAADKKKKDCQAELVEASYEPTVSVSTKKVGDKVEIKVSDNGNGIPQNIIDKIFQPFFTTKPTGQGTGLGLSLSYDIVKAHDGNIDVASRLDKGTDFTIQLPLS